MLKARGIKRKDNGSVKDGIDVLYDGFKIKDMSRAKFRKAYLRVMDPVRMSRELQGVVMKRQLDRQLRVKR
jgi:hypothetical protein